MTLRSMALAALVTAAAHAQAPRGAPKLVVTDFTLQGSAPRELSRALSDIAVRIGYRLSKGVLMDLGVAALYMDLPQTVSDSARAIEDQRVALPPGPAF